jgi:phage gp16-like protein
LPTIQKKGGVVLSRKQLSLIHVAKKQTGLNDEEYRALLSRFGAASSKDLRPKDFDALLEHFKTLGFTSTSRFKKPIEAKKRLLSKIYAIKADLDLTDDYIRGIIKNLFRPDEPKPVQWLNSDQLRRLVAALTYHQMRNAARVIDAARQKGCQ